MQIDRALRVAMAQRDFKQHELADKANISKQTISNICTSRQVPSLTILISLAEVMEMKVSELIALGED